jgi:hypothetical protein
MTNSGSAVAELLLDGRARLGDSVWVGDDRDMKLAIPVAFDLTHAPNHYGFAISRVVASAIGTSMPAPKILPS